MDDASESKRGNEIPAGRAAAGTYPVATLDRSPGKSRGSPTAPAGELSRSIVILVHCKPPEPSRDGLQPCGMK